ncbi:rCG22288 [Rattus norvegicus]|uniref:RCG22288 n=1 Tax=Rattus norvegicus TaxID=10116 RepID=A6INQ6_RAT|nr:rCG22288 [Rattus norvegicus]
MALGVRGTNETQQQRRKWRIGATVYVLFLLVGWHGVGLSTCTHSHLEKMECI